MSAQERVISLDTETTGTSHANGDRIVEIGAVEIIGNLETGRTYHTYLSPYPKAVHEEALAVHGLTDEFLRDKPKFRNVFHEFLDFIGDSPLVIHNAPFDMGFINAEMTRIGRRPLANEVRDTLKMARLKYPGQRATLDALCSRLGVDNSGRDLHGALIDASLLAQVYVKMQELDRLALGAVKAAEPAERETQAVTAPVSATWPRRTAFHPTPEELARHLEFVKAEIKDSLWMNP